MSDSLRFIIALPRANTRE